MKAKLRQAPFVTTQLDLNQTLRSFKDNEMPDDNTNLEDKISDTKLPRWSRLTQSHPIRRPSNYASYYKI